MATNMKGQRSSQPKEQEKILKPPPAKKDKRTLSDVSNASSDCMVDFSHVQSQLDTISSDLADLKNGFNSMLKKDEIQALITSTITNVMEEMEKRIKADYDRKIQEKTKELQETINVLQYDNRQLTDKIEKIEENTKKKMAELTELERDNNRRSKDALRRANQNEQYSRKNNIKLNNVPEEKDEDQETLATKVSNILGKHGVTLDQHEIVAMHRIPAKSATIKPVLIKLLNNNVKTRVMKKRRNLKDDGHRVSDDVTQLNTGLISRLQQHEEVSSAWFFNGSVYAETERSERIKFDIFDSISEVISTYRRKQRTGR